MTHILLNRPFIPRSKDHGFSDSVIIKKFDVPLSFSYFQAFVKHNLITTNEATEILGCSRQNIEDLIRRGKLHPTKVLANGKLFLRAEVEKRNW